MQYWYRGQFSKGLSSIVAMGVTFSGREPSEVTDIAAAAWLDGHPDYVRVDEEPEATPKPETRKAPAKTKARK